MTDLAKASGGIGKEKARGKGESQGGAYPNPHTGKEASRSGIDGLMGHGGQSEMGYHGAGHLGGEVDEEEAKRNAPATSD